MKLRQRKIEKWLNLTKSQWKELCGFLVLIPWLWVDLFDTHNFLKLCLLAISLIIAQGVVCTFFKNRWKALSIWLVSLIPVAAMIWQNSHTLVDSKSYKLLQPDVVTNIVKELLDPKGRVSPAAFLIHPVNPDESAYAISEQLKNIFWEGGYNIIEGTPPASIPQVPGVSCFAYGDSVSNGGIIRALNMILKATQGSSYISVVTEAYPESMQLEPPGFGYWKSNEPSSLPKMINDAKTNLLQRPFPRGVVVIMIRQR